MSLPDPPLARIRLRSPQPGVELTVWDSVFRLVSRRFGDLEVTVPPGLYRLDRRTGDQVESELVALATGEEYAAEYPALPFVAVAPVTGSAAFDDEFAVAAEAASLRLVHSAAGRTRSGGSAGLAMIGYDVAGESFGELFDDRLRPVATWPAGCAGESSSRVRARSRLLRPGGYVWRHVVGGVTAEQSLWLAPGWQTIVFLRTAQDGRLAVSVHLAALECRWRRDDPQHLAAESALTALRHHAPFMPSEQITGWLADRDRANPMVGILGAYTAVHAGTPGPQAYDRLVERLVELVPSHPDVRALRLRTGAGGDLSWPPMVASAYRALILPADRADRLVIRDGSMAERVTGNTFDDGTWLCWKPLDPDEVPAHPPNPMAPTRGATDRIMDFVQDVAVVSGVQPPSVVATWRPADIARATALPLVTVERCLAQAWQVFTAPEEDTARPAELMTPLADMSAMLDDIRTAAVHTGELGGRTAEAYSALVRHLRATIDALDLDDRNAQIDSPALSAGAADVASMLDTMASNDAAPADVDPLVRAIDRLHDALPPADRSAAPHTLTDLVMINFEVGGDGTVRDWRAFQSAREEPWRRDGQVPLYPTPQDKGAALLRGITRARPFRSHNLRTATVATTLLLERAGFVVTADAQALAEVVRAAGGGAEHTDVVRALRKFTVGLPAAEPPRGSRRAEKVER